MKKIYHERNPMQIPILILFNVIVFWRTLKFSIIVDDIRHYQDINNHIKCKPDNIKAFLQLVKERFYGGASLGTNIKFDHALTIFLNCCISVLIYMAFGYSQVSFMAAILYACNPANTQITIWLNGRRYAISIIIVLLMIVYSPWGILLYPITFLNHQVTAIFSLILVKNIHPIFLLAMPALYLMKRKYINHKISNRMKHILCKEQHGFDKKRIIVVFKSYGFYFFNMLMPIRILINYPNLYWWGVMEERSEQCYKINAEFYKGIVAVILSTAGLIYFKEYMLIMWIFMILSTLQWSAILSAVQINTDRYIALPNVFMMFFLAYFISILPYSITIFLCISVYYLCQLSIAMLMYRSIDEYQRYQMFFCPNISKPRFNRIEFYLKQGRFLTAWYLIEEGLQHMPNDFHLLVQASVCAAQLGNVKQAQILTEKASKNYYIGQEKYQGGKLDKFREMISKDQQKYNTRQQRRELERREKKAAHKQHQPY